MAYNTVPTVATGQPWTANDMNIYVKDNFAAGIPDIFTTKGDLAVASGADAAARLAVGTNNAILWAESSQIYGMRWSDFPHARACRAAAQTVTTTPSLLTYTSISYDQGDIEDSGYFLAKVTGYYLITVLYHFQPSGSSPLYDSENVQLLIYKNGSHSTTLAYFSPASGLNITGFAYFSACDILYLTAGQGIGIYHDLYTVTFGTLQAGAALDANQLHVSVSKIA